MESLRQQLRHLPLQRGNSHRADRGVLATLPFLVVLVTLSPGDSLLRRGALLEALPHFISHAESNPRNWFPAYRVSWILNRLDRPGEALPWAVHAHGLRPGNVHVLGELLRSHAPCPDSVLKYGILVSGGGVCRYRLARAEKDLGVPGIHFEYLEHVLVSGNDSSRADAACWLGMLHPGRALDLFRTAVDLAPREEFYRTLLAERLAREGHAGDALDVLMPVSHENHYYWKALALCHEAAGDLSQAGDAYRRAYDLRQCPAAAGDLGWHLHNTARDMIRSDRFPEALQFLREASVLWSPDSSWATASSELLLLADEFLRLGSGWGRLR